MSRLVIEMNGDDGISVQVQDESLLHLPRVTFRGYEADEFFANCDDLRNGEIDRFVMHDPSVTDDPSEKQQDRQPSEKGSK